MNINDERLDKMSTRIHYLEDKINAMQRQQNTLEADQSTLSGQWALTVSSTRAELDAHMHKILELYQELGKLTDEFKRHLLNVQS